MKKKTLAILHDDPWLEPFAPAIEGRHEDAVRKLSELTGDKMSLSDFANALLRFAPDGRGVGIPRVGA